MPTFPKYRGELPQCLNPLNLRHYWLLAYWIYFRPTALKCYLYQADPKLYRADGWLSLFRTLRVPAYRNLYLLIPFVSVLLSFLVGLLGVLTASLFSGKPVNWLGLAFSVAFGVALGVAFGVALGVAEGVALGVAAGVAAGVAFGVAFGVASRLADGVALGVAAGVAFGVAFGLASGLAFGVALGVASGVALGVASGVALGVALGVGALRIPFYLFQVGSTLLGYFWRIPHALAWDELVILPLPGTLKILTRRLQREEGDGLQFLSDLVCNPFQGWAVQRTLSSYLHQQAAPLRFFYTLLTNPSLDAYVFAPVGENDWRKLPATKQVLLGELDQQWVDSNQPFDRLVWSLTRFLRDRRQTPLTRFAGMLYRLLDEKTVNAEDFDLGKERPIYARLTNYPGGVEIEQSFNAMASFLSYKQLSDLPAAIDIVGAKAFVPLQADDTAIRPTVLTALNRLRDIASEVTTYLAATSRVNKQAALLRATDSLKTLDDYVAAEVVPPEQTILQRIIRQWSDLIIKEGGEVGRDEILEPVANPYVVGNPVTNHLFVGREDIMRRLEELWMVKGQCPSVVIYGHRRMGKSSILRNLGASLGSQTTVVDFNMQRVGLVDTTGELLYNFALSIYDALPISLQDQLGEPDEERFTSHNPYTALDRFLKQLDPVRAEQRFIITIDEFELIEQLIEQQRLEPRLLDFWRGLIQTYPWFVLAFAGLHTLQEMTQNYWNPLFGSVTAIPVSFLSPKSAERLISQPSPDFNLDYDPEAIAEIIQLTNGQPYLVQLIGHTLVTRFNRQMFEERIERERRFTLEDIQVVINTPEFYRDGNAYFNGVWVQAENSEPAGQTAILETLSQTGLSITEIAQKTSFSLEQVQSALKTLQRHDVVKQQDEKYFYTVELMRRWVVRGTGQS